MRQPQELPWQEIKLIVSDMDGTLLNREKGFSSSITAAYAAARQAGLYVTFATGRIHPMVDAYIRTLDIQCPVVTTNGGVIVSPEGKVLHQKTVDLKTVLPLLERCRRAKTDYCVLTFTGCWFTDYSLRRQRFVQYNEIAARSGYTPIPLHTFSNIDHPHDTLAGERISKLLIYEPNPLAFQQCAQWIQEIPELSYTTSEENLLDVMAADVSKGAGVLALCKILGLSAQNLCVFGDYFNDVSMFEVAGIAVAMGNAPIDVQNKADYICPPNDQDGVADTIFRHILRRNGCY